MSKIQDFPESYSLIPLTPMISHVIPLSTDLLPSLTGRDLGRADGLDGPTDASGGRTNCGGVTPPKKGRGASSGRHGTVHRYLREQDRPQGPRVRAGDLPCHARRADVPGHRRISVVQAAGTSLRRHGLDAV